MKKLMLVAMLVLAVFAIGGVVDTTSVIGASPAYACGAEPTAGPGLPGGVQAPHNCVDDLQTP